MHILFHILQLNVGRIKHYQPCKAVRLVTRNLFGSGASLKDKRTSSLRETGYIECRLVHGIRHHNAQFESLDPSLAHDSGELVPGRRGHSKSSSSSAVHRH